jgi:hypothetical protein
MPVMQREASARVLCRPVGGIEMVARDRLPLGLGLRRLGWRVHLATAAR